MHFEKKNVNFKFLSEWNFKILINVFFEKLCTVF